jgi:hypothetical protein
LEKISSEQSTVREGSAALKLMKEGYSYNK